MKYLLSLILFLSLSANGFATTYYVDNTSGDNTNTGLVGQPWKELPGTINPTGTTSGWVKLAPGDTVVLTSGQEWNKGVLINSTYYQDGTSGSRVTITVSSPPTRAIFDFNGGATDLAASTAAIHLRRDYVDLKYLEIREITKSGTVAGIYIGNADANDYNRILYCYIHDIIDSTTITGSVDACTGENYSYGVVMVWATGTEIAYNEIKNIDKKFIGSSETYGGSHLIHHNVLHNEADFTGDPIDHGIAMSSLNGGNQIYNNIIWNNHKYYGHNYAINLVQSGSNNKVYNNIIRGWNIGITSRTSGVANNSNEIINNTIYLADTPATRHTCYYTSNNHFGIYLSNSDSNIVRNNLVYYPELDGGVAYMLWQDSSADLNTYSNNLFYRSGTEERVRIDNVQQTVAWLNSTFSNTDAADNLVAAPVFAGGSFPVANLPTGFDSNWYPTPGGLALTVSSAAVDTGYTMGSPYDTDIAGVARPQGGAWDIGAYELGSAGGVSGTVTAENMTESTIVAGGATLDVTIVNDTLEASIDAYRQEFIDSCVSAVSAATLPNGWNAEVVADEVVTAVTRVSDTSLRWTLSANANYAINQTDGAVTCYVPHEMLVTATEDVVPTPVFSISNEEAASLATQTVGVFSVTGATGSYSATGASAR